MKTGAEEAAAAAPAPVAPAEPQPVRGSALAGLVRAAGDVVTQVAAFLLSMAILIGLLALLGYDPAKILGALWDGAAGSSFAIGVSVAHAMAMMLTATGVWLAYQAGLFNIGGDGQLQLGGVAGLVVALVLPAGLPGPLVAALGLLAAAAVGAAWAALPAVLKTYRGASEVISTIMLNFAAFQIVTQLMNGPLRNRTVTYIVNTRSVPQAVQLPALIPETTITAGVVVSLVVALVTVLFVQRTDTGLRLRAIGLNHDAAVHAGVVVRRYWLASFSISGALAGLAGGLVILGVRYYIAPGWAESWGLVGILVAFLCLRSPYIIPLWSLLFGMLIAAAPILKASASVPDSIVIVMQTLPVIALYTIYAVTRTGRRLLRRAALGPAADA